jgi:hypothetical protein
VSDIDLEKLRAAVAEFGDNNNVSRTHRYSSVCLTTEAYDTILDAAKSLLPKTKMVECWDAECYTASGNPHVARHETKLAAEAKAEEWKTRYIATLVRVTGPHMHEVPA